LRKQNLRDYIGIDLGADGRTAMTIVTVIQTERTAKLSDHHIGDHENA